MFTEQAHLNQVEPLVEASPELSRLGFHIVPIIPPHAPHKAAGKMPGHFIGGRWSGLENWQGFRDRKPTREDLGLWCGLMPGANIGIVCGSDAGEGLVVLAVDVDTDDGDEFDSIIRALPQTRMEKRGHKGTTRFYRAAPTLRSLSYNVAGGRRIVDLLSGNQTRQTVAPPSLHPKGMRYRWTLGPVPASSLSEFTAADLEKLEDTLKHLGWAGRDSEQIAAREVAIARIDSGESNFFDEVKTSALANLASWVPALDLYKLRKARGGFECVATWRASSSGQPLEHRKRNLSIQRNGIKDFGEDKTYTPIDLVISAKGWSVEESANWLAERLGLVEGVDVSGLVAQSERSASIASEPAPQTGESGEPVRFPWMDEEHGNTTTAQSLSSLAAIGDDDLPDDLTRVPGLLGDITDWICDSSRRPLRALALGAALVTLGTAAGRRYGSPTRSGTHLYIVGLARTGAGKDHPAACVSTLLQHADLQRLIGPGDINSWTSLLWAVAGNPAAVSVLDELGAFLKRANGVKAQGYEQGVSRYLRTLWGKSFASLSPPSVQSTNPHRVMRPIHSPSFSIFGVSTPEEFYDAISGSDVTNGFLNRFLLLSTLSKPLEREPIADRHSPPQELIKGLKEVSSAGGELWEATHNQEKPDLPPVEAEWADDSARQVYEAFKRDIEAREEDAAWFARTVEMSQRVAAIRAIGECPARPRISADCMRWACALVLWSGERMKAEAAAHMAENPFQADCKRVLRIIKENGGSMTRSALTKRLQKRFKPQELTNIIAALREAQDIAVSEQAAASGPKATIYTALKS